MDDGLVGRHDVDPVERAPSCRRPVAVQVRVVGSVRRGELQRGRVLDLRPLPADVEHCVPRCMAQRNRVSGQGGRCGWWVLGSGVCWCVLVSAPHIVRKYKTHKG